MRYKFLMALIIVGILISGTAQSHAGGWLVYSKPEFKGKVVDAETKEPIEGAVVVVTYTKTTMMWPEHYSSIIEVRESLTDKDGKFYIPSYTTLIQPLSREDMATFIIFKPGYASVSGLNLENTFSQETAKEVELPWLYNKDVKFRFAAGLVELPSLKTKEERLKAMPGRPTDYRSTELPLLYKAMNEENKRFGLGEER